ncbi:ribosome assembly protein METTL17, mitochondrial [Lepisosteus oculatus]|uniref:ribosome assembly protein METTL17, mitochondrial n=1 Tax=Lepisosteus oculatus TaxID=7918 RepID=UPI0037121CC2
MAALGLRFGGSCALCQGAIVRRQSAVVARQSQVDNSGDFLSSTPHRRHPGITALTTVRLPADLERAALTLIHGAAVSSLSDRTQRLTNFLWSRKRPVDDQTLRERALILEKQARERETGRQTDNEALEARVRRRVLSELKRTTYHWTPLKYDADLSLVYLAARLAGGYAAVTRALHEIKKRVPSFSPGSLLDFGSGTGSVAWAAHSLWGESLKEFVCVDSSGAMNSLADLLVRGGCERADPHIQHLYFRQFLPVTPKVQFDVVVSAFSLSELPSSSERRDTVQTLWRKTHSFLVLLENGTREGHQILMEARDTVLQAEDKVTYDPRGASVFAPCPHQLPCPRLAQQPHLPCNFVQPYIPLPLTGSPERLEERFSYVVLSRAGPEPSAGWPRLIGPVQKRARHVQCQLCCSDGQIQRVAVTARQHGRDLYRCTRSSAWGDRLPVVNPEVDAQSGSEEP